MKLRYTGVQPTTFRAGGWVEPGDELDVPDDKAHTYLRRADVEHAEECPAPPCQCYLDPQDEERTGTSVTSGNRYDGGITAAATQATSLAKERDSDDGTGTSAMASGDASASQDAGDRGAGQPDSEAAGHPAASDASSARQDGDTSGAGSSGRRRAGSPRGKSAVGETGTAKDGSTGRSVELG
jgi:hypothetical protein